MEKKFLIYVAALFFLATSVCFAGTGAKYQIKNDKLYKVPAEGNVVAVDGVEVKKAFIGKDLIYWAGVTAQEDGQISKEHTGLYFFDKNGISKGFLPFEEAQFCADIQFSPGGGYVVLDCGTWIVRELSIYSFKYANGFSDFQKKTVISAIGKYTWIDGGSLAYTAVDNHKPRPRDSDFTGRCSAAVYYCAGNKHLLMERATDLADYSFESMQERNMLIKKDWVDKVSDWKNPDKIKTEQLKRTVGGTLPVPGKAATQVNSGSKSNSSSGGQSSNKHSRRAIQKAREVRDAANDRNK